MIVMTIYEIKNKIRIGKKIKYKYHYICKKSKEFQEFIDKESDK